MHHHEYPKIDAKFFHYHNDGTGRDQYVKHTNGGLLSQKQLIKLELSPKSTFNRMKFTTPTNTRSKMLLPSPHQKITHYYGDGKGRDYHVTIKDGGQVQLNRWRDHPDVSFPAQLRDYKQQYSSPDATQYLMPNNEALQTKTLTMKFRQTELSKQLSEPKLPRNPKRLSFIPDLQTGGSYQTYQQPKYQSKSQWE